MNTGKKYVIGIDAGVKSGLAIYNRQTKKIIYRKTATFWLVYEFVKTFEALANMLIIVETPKKNFVYSRNAKLGIGAVTKIAFNSGENNRESSLLVEGFEALGFEVRQVTPTAAKWSAADLKRYTGITECSNSHERDAISLCWQA